MLSLPTLTQSSLDSPVPPGQCPLPITHLSPVVMGELPQQGMPGGGHGRLYLMLTSCGDTEGACSRLTCSASVSTGPTCSVSSALVTTVSGGMQGTCRTAGDSTLAGEDSDSHRSGRVPRPCPPPQSPGATGQKQTKQQPHFLVQEHQENTDQFSLPCQPVRAQWSVPCLEPYVPCRKPSPG